jgi:hypothetical protein
MIAEMTPFERCLEIANAAKPETITASLQSLFSEIHAAGLLDSERDVLFEAVRKKTKARVSGIRKDWEKYLATRDVEAKQEQDGEPVPKDVEEAADRLLRSRHLLQAAIAAIGRLGVVGEKANRGVLYLALTSCSRPEPISAFVKGRSSSGKSNLVKRALALMPPESYYEFTAMSSKALVYNEELELAHKHLIIYEEDGNEEAQYIVRTLLSEGRISYLTTEKGEKGMTGRRIEREGPTGLITTMTKAATRDDNETRAWSLYVDDSKAQTEAVIESLGDEAAKIVRPAVDNRPWQALQRKLEPLEVVVPYGPVLAKLLNTEGLPADSTRLRRDFGRLLTLVKVVALLYQKQRDRDDAGRLIATLEDYRMAYDLVAKPFAESARELSPQAVKLAQAVRELYDKQPPSDTQPITPRQLEGYLRWTKPTVLRWLGQVEAVGLAELEQGRGNQPTRITPLGSPGRVTLGLLPEPAEIEKKFSSQSGGTSFTQNRKEGRNASETECSVLKPRKTASTALKQTGLENVGGTYAFNANKHGLYTEKASGGAKDGEKAVCFN